jgi:hypothetical protein
LGAKCLEAVSVFWKGKCTALDKVGAIRGITNILSSASPPLTETEINDSLETYLQIIEQHERSLAAARTSGSERSETADDAATGMKWAISPSEPLEVTKRQKVDEKDFPWAIRETITSPGLSEELQKTLNLLQTYAKDLKFMKSSILTSPFAPQFPNSEWSNVIIGAMVDLDHVISGSFAVSSDNREVEVIGGIQFKFGAARASKHVKSSGDWFIAWNLYSKAVSFAFPHRLNELSLYSQQILGLFAATTPGSHTNVINLDKAIWVHWDSAGDLTSRSLGSRQAR